MTENQVIEIENFIKNLTESESKNALFTLMIEMPDDRANAFLEAIGINQKIETNDFLIKNKIVNAENYLKTNKALNERLKELKSIYELNPLRILPN